MDKIVIAELDIDVKALISSTTQVKKAMDDLKKEQKDLSKNGQDNSEQFVENAANLKLLNSEYNAGVKAISENTKAIADQANRAELLNLALNQEINSIDEARAQNKLLNKLRNEAVTSTGEQSQEVKDLNKKLDENNEFIKANADAYLQQKINIGNYSDSIKEALGNLNPLNGGMGAFVQRSKDAGGVGNLLTSSLKQVAVGFWGIIQASLAFIATPIGAVIAVVAGAALILYNVFKSFQPVVDKVEQSMASLMAVLNVIKNTVLAVITGTKSLGEAFNGLGGDMNKAAKEAAALTKAQQDLEDSMASQEVISKRNRAEINKLNVELKNRTKSEQERLAISDEIIKKENADYLQRKAIVDQEVKNARAAIAIKAQFTEDEKKQLKELGDATKTLAESRGGNYDEEYKALNDARIKAIDLEDEVTVNLEKQYSRRDKLQDEAKAKSEKAEADRIAAQKKAQEEAAKIIDAAIEKNKQELNLFIESQGIKAKSLEEELNISRQVRDKRLAILQQELANKKITQTQFDLESLRAKNEYLKQEADIVVANAQIELNHFIEKNKTTVKQNKFLTDQLVAEELSRLSLIAEEQKKFEATKLEEGIVNKQTYNDAITAIDTATAEQQKVLLDEKTAADLEKNQIDLDNKIATDQADLDSLIAQLEAKRVAEVLAAEKTGADVALINKKYEKAKTDIVKASEEAKLAAISNTLGQAASLFKENTAAYKALAIAQTLISTYSSAVKAYDSLAGIPIVGPALGGIAAGVAVASGLANVAKISGVKFEKGGIQEVGGNRHSAGGTKFYGEDGTTFEAEKGEGIGVLNRGAFASFMDFNNNYSNGGKSTPTFMAGGGIITQGVSSNTNNGISQEMLMDAIANMPAPIVTVQDINYQTGQVVRVVGGADF